MTPLETLNLAMASKTMGGAKDHATIAAGERMQRRAFEAPSANVIAQLEKAQAEVAAERKLDHAQHSENAVMICNAIHRVEEAVDGDKVMDRTSLYQGIGGGSKPVVTAKRKSGRVKP